MTAREKRLAKLDGIPAQRDAQLYNAHGDFVGTLYFDPKFGYELVVQLDNRTRLVYRLADVYR